MKRLKKMKRKCVEGGRACAVSALHKLPHAEFVPTLKSLFGNPVYIIYLCVTILQFNSLIGMVTYKPKYIEQHYGQSASNANFLMGKQSIFSCLDDFCLVILSFVDELEACSKPVLPY